eukprot:CAMPEP_0198210648 /NCGR_PEP_ID=MMETSP1445-20131203/21384_1 /TAXON_ID=36898 /ORGANISM="Pyramimonas sp., Strain CCMP2087" /LENGTH=71 /DNA_ID=CAMNT_0043884763 /DNA_START=250 /DNA_END=462 /DNA_ORIENTATION=-
MVDKAVGGRKLLTDVRFMLNAAPNGYLEKHNYKLLNTNMKQYRDLQPNEKAGPFTFTDFKGTFRGDTHGNL